jgi:predicted nucleic acid-binding protein
VVLRGEEGGYSDALQTKLTLQRGQLIVVEVEETSPEINGLPLHKGEKETIHCALEKEADLVLLDDMLARSEAKNAGLTVKGTLGVIVDAYRHAILSIEEVRIIFDNILARNDIWIADEVCRRVFERLKGSS